MWREGRAAHRRHGNGTPSELTAEEIRSERGTWNGSRRRRLGLQRLGGRSTSLFGGRQECEATVIDTQFMEKFLK